MFVNKKTMPQKREIADAVKKFGNRLKNEREKLGMRQVDLGKKLGVSTNTIQSWESDTIPKGTHLLILSRMFGVSIEWLLTGVGERYCRESKSGEENLDVPTFIRNGNHLNHLHREDEHYYKKGTSIPGEDKNAKILRLLAKIMEANDPKITDMVAIYLENVTVLIANKSEGNGEQK